MRLGAAYMEIHENALAHSILTKAAHLEPNNKELREQLEKVKQKVQVDHEKDKSLFFGMFNKS